MNENYLLTLLQMMDPTKLLRTTVALFTLGAIAFASSGFGCSMGVQSDEDLPEFHVAEVDSIDVPERIAPTDTLSVRLFGTVGPNGCYSLDRIKEDRSDGQLTVTPVVRYERADDVACTMALVPLDATYEAEPPFDKGTLQVVVPQSDDPDVTATVEVTDDE